MDFSSCYSLTHNRIHHESTLLLGVIDMAKNYGEKTVLQIDA